MATSSYLTKKGIGRFKVLMAGLSLAVTVALSAADMSSAAAAADPFAPAGTELVRIEVPDRATAGRIHALGIRPEEGGRDFLQARVTDAELELLRSHGFRFTIINPKEGDSAEIPPGVSRMPLFTSYSQMVTELNQIVADYPDLAVLTSYGTSVQGRGIWALKITRNPAQEEVEPEVRLIGAHHGNERMSVEITLRMAHYLVDNYGIDSTVTALVDSREIWIVPMMNPDGVEAGSRYNAHGVDLNRNWGYMWEGGGSGPFSEPETRSMHDLATDNWFSLSLSFHTSGDVVNSVWNYSPIYTEDDDLVWTLTDGYASFNGYWAVRGWYWYETHGDCNDYSYGARGDLDWTIEMDDYGEDTVWGENRDAILYIIDAAGWGVHGQVTDAITGAPLRARVYVGGRDWPAFTDPVLGDFHKPLLGGTYELRVSANGYRTKFLPFVTVPPGDGVLVNVQLTPGGDHYADRVELANVADPADTYDNETLTMSMLGTPNDVGCSMGRGGDAVLDLGPGSEVRDISGDDLMVFESTEDAEVEGFRLYGGDSYLGPWTHIGDGMGSTAFDIAGTGLSLVRYIRIEDDGDGSMTGANPGFELDAIESYGGQVTGIDDRQLSGTEDLLLALAPPAPNPVRDGSSTEIEFTVAGEAAARLDVFDARGRLVTQLAEGVFGREQQRARWSGDAADGSPAATGIYFVRLATGSQSVARKLLLLR